MFWLNLDSRRGHCLCFHWRRGSHTMLAYAACTAAVQRSFVIWQVKIEVTLREPQSSCEDTGRASVKAPGHCRWRVASSITCQLFYLLLHLSLIGTRMVLPESTNAPSELTFKVVYTLYTFRSISLRIRVSLLLFSESSTFDLAEHANFA